MGSIGINNRKLFLYSNSGESGRGGQNKKKKENEKHEVKLLLKISCAKALLC